MSITKFSSEEFVSMMESKVVKRKISLEDILQIISDERFPDHLSSDAIDELKKYSAEYKRYKAVSTKLTKQQIICLELFLKLNRKISSGINKYGKNKDKSVFEEPAMQELKDKIEQKKELISQLTIEFKILHSYFNKVKKI
jgi:hypothetical protein